MAEQEPAETEPSALEGVFKYAKQTSEALRTAEQENSLRAAIAENTKQIVKMIGKGRVQGRGGERLESITPWVDFQGQQVRVQEEAHYHNRLNDVRAGEWDPYSSTIEVKAADHPDQFAITYAHIAQMSRGDGKQVAITVNTNPDGNPKGGAMMEELEFSSPELTVIDDMISTILEQLHKQESEQSEAA